MLTEIYMPKNGMDMTEGTLVHWLKNVGDPVEQGEPIMEIETDKVTMEAEAPAAGRLLKKLYQDGSVVPVLTTIGYIGQQGDVVQETETAQLGSQASAEQSGTSFSAVDEAAILNADKDVIPATPYAKTLAKQHGIDLRAIPAIGSMGVIRGTDVETAISKRPCITPLARRIADDMAVDVTQIQGTGFRGKITKADVLSAKVQPKAERASDASVSVGKQASDRIPLNSMRKVIAKRMLSSHTHIPPVTTAVKVDVTDLLVLRKKINVGREPSEKFSINDFIIMATGKALLKNERFRLRIDGDSYVLHDKINVGVAVGMDDGLLVPVLRDVDQKTLSQISKEAKELAGKARKGDLRPADITGGCITISNLGMYGTYYFTPIINQPEASIIGVCDIEDELALIDNQVMVRKKTILCTTYDHRIINGVEASKFQADLKSLLENPVEILC